MSPTFLGVERPAKVDILRLSFAKEPTLIVTVWRKRAGAALGGAFIILGNFFGSPTARTLVIAAILGAVVVGIYYKTSKRAPLTWKPITGGAIGGAVISALVVLRQGPTEAVGYGIGYGLALAMLNYSFRGPLGGKSEGTDSGDAPTGRRGEEDTQPSADESGGTAAPESLAQENNVDSDSQTTSRPSTTSGEGENQPEASVDTPRDDAEKPDWLKPTETAAGWSKRLLYTLQALAAFWLVVDYMGYGLVSTAARGGAVSPSDVEFVSGAVQMLSGLWLFGYIATAIAFLAWFRKAHNNLTRLGVQDVKYSANWAVGGFFVPILNLFRPYQIARQIAKGSTATPSDSDTRKTQSTPSIVKWWWGLFLISNFISWTLGRANLSESTRLVDLKGYFLLDGLSNLLLLAAAIAAVKMIVFVMNQQRDKLQQLRR